MEQQELYLSSHLKQLKKKKPDKDYSKQRSLDTGQQVAQDSDP